jgi:cytoskeleton protein RodZ
MASVGAYLRELRQQRGLSLEEIARTTRVASRYLESLEADAFSDLPEPVFTRGFVRAYCQALGESPESALALYEQRDGRVPPAPTAAGAPRTAASRTSDGEPRTRGAVLVSFVLLVVLGLALFAVTLMIQPQRDERVERRSPMVVAPSIENTSPPVPATPPPATPSVPLGPPRPAGLPAPAAPAPAGAARPMPPTGASSATAPASGGSPAAPAAPASVVTTAPPGTSGDLQAALASVSSPYHLVARTSEPTWIRVRTDDGRMTEETVPAGQVREWVSNRPLVVTVGNAGGVSFELNGRKLPALGGSGAVIHRIVLPPEGQ